MSKQETTPITSTVEVDLEQIQNQLDNLKRAGFIEFDDLVDVLDNVLDYLKAARVSLAKQETPPHSAATVDEREEALFKHFYYAIQFFVNYHSFDTKLNKPDWQIAEEICDKVKADWTQTKVFNFTADCETCPIRKELEIEQVEHIDILAERFSERNNTRIAELEKREQELLEGNTKLRDMGLAIQNDRDKRIAELEKENEFLQKDYAREESEHEKTKEQVARLEGMIKHADEAFGGAELKYEKRIAELVENSHRKNTVIADLKDRIASLEKDLAVYKGPRFTSAGAAIKGYQERIRELEAKLAKVRGEK